MAKKAKSVYVCNECGSESPKWLGQCPVCGAWNSMFEEKIMETGADDKRRRGQAIEGERAKASKLFSVVTSSGKGRIDTGIGELNRVLGGGLVPGSLTLISGEPGIGKSTVIMQVANNFAEKNGVVLYVSGEESDEQIKMRADRICDQTSEDFYILSETALDQVVAVAEEIKPKFIIIDSIQTMFMSEVESAPGSVSQVRACGNELMRIGKTHNIPVFIVAHVTKSGELAGPKIVEHLVDCVLNITGERSGELRLLRSFKNRFGNTSEIGAFEMSEKGLIEVKDLSKRFLEGMDELSPGAMIGATYEGTRPLLFEIQALAAPTSMNFPRRTSVGFDHNRLNMILAVLERRAHVRVSDQDVYINIVGGIRPEGTSSDLGVAMAIYSSIKNIALDEKTIAIGEIGLTGDIRPVQNIEKIVKEASRMGYGKVVLPKTQADKIKMDAGSIRVIGVKKLGDALELFNTGGFEDF